MFHFGVIHYNFPGFSFEQFLTFAAETGYKYLELNLPDIWEESVEHPLSGNDMVRQAQKTEAVRKQVESFGLKVSALAARNDFVQTDPAQVEFQVARMRGVAEQARLLMEKPILRTEGGFPKDSVRPEEYYVAMVDCFGRCTGFLDELGVDIAVDNHGLITNDAELLLRVLRHINHPRVGSNLDTMNLRWWGHSVEECNRFYTELAPFVKHVHLKDGFGSRENYKGAALGEGEIDLQHAITALSACDYNGVYCAEYEGSELEGGVGYRKCFEWMKSHLR
jgi:sugar phosphate isomerase/epimerase